MKEYEVIVIGCGASGSIASIYASKNYNKILIIDKNSKPLKKLLVTGNGRCNLTNTNVKSDFYNQNIDPYLLKYPLSKTLDFFKSIGLETYFDEEGRVYPITNSAKSVVDVLYNAIEKNKIEISLDEEVIEIIKKDEKFLIRTNKNEYFSPKVVIATGGNLIDVISKFNIEIRKFCPSLVSLKTENTKNLSGTRISPVIVKAVNSLGQEKHEYGEILFKESGLSGICIFNVSTIFSRINEFKGKISIDLLPKLTSEDLFKLLIKRKKLDVKVNKFFEGLFINPIAYEILNKLKLNENKSSLELTDTELNSMVEIIKNFKFNVLDCYDNNQVFSGGVKLSELNENLEAKNIKGLFFCGEICDVDGECGGFNLQWAWTSGYIVGNNI